MMAEAAPTVIYFYKTQEIIKITWPGMLKSLNTVCSHPIFALNFGKLGMGWAYSRS